MSDEPGFEIQMGDAGSDDTISAVANDATERLQRVAAALGA
jgi:hypothetical protein